MHTHRDTQVQKTDAFGYTVCPITCNASHRFDRQNRFSLVFVFVVVSIARKTLVVHKEYRVCMGG